MDETLLRHLLSEGESSRLDYKSKQYPYAGGTDFQKSELLKDILAMANASRELEAFILIGVAQKPGARARVVGIVDHQDDADIQEFVNFKTNRPIRFSYSEFQAEGVTLGVIRIPVQDRPFFAKKHFGRVKAREVYVRRGSATVIADPDEVLGWGMSAASSVAPSLSLEFAHVGEHRRLGRTLTIECVVNQPLDDKSLPVVSEQESVMAYSTSLLHGELNRDYWREMREYVFLKEVIAEVGFVVSNNSAVIAEGVRAIFEVEDIPEILVREERPERPRYRDEPFLSRRVQATLMTGGQYVRDVEIAKRGGRWHIEVTFGKVQPGASAWTQDELLIGTMDTREVILMGNLFGDNFQPVPVELTIVSKPTVRGMTMDDLRSRDED